MDSNSDKVLEIETSLEAIHDYDDYPYGGHKRCTFCPL